MNQQDIIKYLVWAALAYGAYYLYQKNKAAPVDPWSLPPPDYIGVDASYPNMIASN